MRNLIFKNLNWLKIFTIFLVTFAAGFFVIKNLPANHNLSCSIGANFTAKNLIVLAVFSILFALNVILITEISINKNIKKIGLVGASFLIMSLATICTLCILPTLIIFGFSLGLSFMSLHNTYFQLTALALASFSSYMLYKSYTNECLVKCSTTKKRG